MKIWIDNKRRGTHPTLIERKPMKGFMHIVEIIIVGLTLLFVISLSADIPRMDYDWTKTKLIIYGNDLLFTLEEKGISWLDGAQVGNSINGLLPRNVEFDLKVKNAIKPNISLGCVCPQEMLGVIEEFLDDFQLNGADTSFRVEWINHSRLSFPLTLDLMFFLDTHIPEEKSVELENYLKNGGGVLEISGPDMATTNRPIYRDIFNLEWVDEAVVMEGEAGLQETEPGKGNYNIRKYFYHVPFRIELVPDSPPGGVTSCTGEYVSGRLTFREGDYQVWVIDGSSSTCELAFYVDINDNNYLNDSGEGPFSEGESLELDGQSFLVRETEWDHAEIVFQEPPEYGFKPAKLGETVYPLDNSSDKIFLKRTDVLYSDGRAVPLSTINYNVIDGKGRVAWLSNSTASELKSDTEQLIKSLIIWTAGEEYWLARGREKTDTSTFHFFSNLNQDMFQPIELILTLGYRQ